MQQATSLSPKTSKQKKEQQQTSWVDGYAQRWTGGQSRWTDKKGNMGGMRGEGKVDGDSPARNPPAVWAGCVGAARPAGRVIPSQEPPTPPQTSLSPLQTAANQRRPPPGLPAQAGCCSARDKRAWEAGRGRRHGRVECRDDGTVTDPTALCYIAAALTRTHLH